MAKPMKMKVPIEIDSDLLVQFNRISAVLGISPARYIESYLKDLLASLGQDPALYVANELFFNSYPSRELAEAAAEKFEAYAIEQKLEGNGVASVISTEVVEYQSGFWRVKVNHLTHRGWRVVASDLWEDGDENEGEEWKGKS
jgi:hypothetical protein